MIRTAILAAYWILLIVLVGPLLIVYGWCGGSPEIYYRWGVSWALFPIRRVGIRTRVEGLENIPAGACLFAANHVSFMDPPLLVGAIPKRIGVLLKKSLFVPIAGTAFRIAHFIPVDRTNAAGAMASVHAAAGYMRQGLSYLIYPEGTRSLDGRLLPFKRAGFALAIEAKVPVVPVACAGAQRILPKNSLRIHAGEVVVRFCPPIDAAVYSMTQRGELAQRVHAAVASALPEEQRPLAAVSVSRDP